MFHGKQVLRTRGMEARRVSKRSLGFPRPSHASLFGFEDLDWIGAANIHVRYFNPPLTLPPARHRGMAILYSCTATQNAFVGA